MNDELDTLRQEILSKVEDYYLQSKKREDKFIPTQSPVNYAGRCFDEKELINLINSSLDFWLTHGKYGEEFERKLSQFLSIKYTHLVNSGSSANLLAFMSLTSPLLQERRIKPADEVITVAACFPTTISPIIQYGAIPVFVDIDKDTLNVDISKLDQALSPKTKAVFLAHTLGNPFAITEVVKFCKKNDLWLIEDNCDALGSEYKGKKTGTFGDIGTSSFYPPHHITMGEGGAVYTDNKLLSKIILSMRDWGRDCWCPPGVDNTCKNRFNKQYGKLPFGYDHKYVYSHFGYNLKATEMQAAIGVAQIDKLEDFIRARRENFTYLLEKLQVLNNILGFIINTDGAVPAWFGFGIYLKHNTSINRNQLVQILESKKIQTRNLFAGNIIKHPCFDHLLLNKDYRIIDNLYNTEDVMNNFLWVGVYPGMTKDKLDYMSQIIIDAFLSN